MLSDLPAFARIIARAWRAGKLRQVGAAVSAAERAVECERRINRAKPIAQLVIDGRTWQIVQSLPVGQPIILGDDKGNRWKLERQ